ncbi:MAG: SAM-dependent methyltransferase [Desulfovibrio sp.]|nr:SAM-dependent methyltransferase [Desulfovibrio sp.]|tara:strand:- start:26704 stop:29343 length:2640 start_codon:yes stop_codon:yes gene_type:complete
MNTTQLYKKLQKLVDPVSKDDFIFDLLLTYSTPKAQITQLRNGTNNRSNIEGQLILARKVLFQPADSGSLFTKMEELRNDQRCMRHKPRFFVVTDYKSLLAYDTKVDDTLDIPLIELPKNMEFFMPWAGRERYAETMENPADVKAAERMARLYDEILRNNPDAEKDPEERHKLNVFLSRLLFCFFAEDTDIFPNNIFSKAITELTEDDGSDLDKFLNQLFEVLNTESRKGCIDQLCKFPYVNGGLFGDSYDAPKMTSRARRLVIECGALDWSDINPDIFGSMIQAVVDPEQRGGLGMHYTSVPNIMKVIEPLFLNDLREEFKKAYDDAKKLAKLLNRIRQIRFFDPACGSGNFLIITYKEIRKLEMEIVERRKNLDGYIPLHSLITLDHFYGIEIDDFAHEVAILSLWLAEHQMNVQFKKRFGDARPALPLREGGYVICGNATRLNWRKICPIHKNNEVFIMGNPPYLGARLQKPTHKQDIEHVCGELPNHNNLDYISCWFVKGADYVKNGTASLAFVSTNSVCQGEQVPLLWPHVLTNGLGISFAHKSFLWNNHAKGNAGVTCVVIGLSKVDGKKFIFEEQNVTQVKSITPYITPGKPVYISKKTNPISELPKCAFGSMPNDNGELLLTEDERLTMLDECPNAETFIKRAYGSKDYINGIKRYCLWIPDELLDQAMAIPCIERRVNHVREYRLNSTRQATVRRGEFPHQFGEIRHREAPSIIIPRHSSRSRDYIPIGYLEQGAVVLDSAMSVLAPKLYVFGILTSRMHMAWISVVGGRIKTDYRYSSAICYNTFPVPRLNKKQISLLEDKAVSVLDIRDEHIGKTMAELYAPGEMPDDLREAHRQLDLAVDSCYRKKPFESDSERLEHLFKMYEKMTA